MFELIAGFLFCLFVGLFLFVIIVTEDCFSRYNSHMAILLNKTNQ